MLREVIDAVCDEGRGGGLLRPETPDRRRPIDKEDPKFYPKKLPFLNNLPKIVTPPKYHLKVALKRFSKNDTPNKRERFSLVAGSREIVATRRAVKPEMRAMDEMR